MKRFLLKEQKTNERRKSVMCKKAVIALALLCIVLPLTAQQRGGGYEEGAVEIVDARSTVTPLGKQWAVFIAVDEYLQWGKLDHPVNDAREIKEILLQHYYIDEFIELYNRDATASAIRRLFAELQDRVGVNDSVFVFHAGHGINETRTNSPAWIPYDGGTDIYAQSNWLYHTQIRSMLDSLRAQHVFLISDSCYSGNLLVRSRGEAQTIINIPAAYLQKSRQVMSSGADERVNDVSEFASRLKYVLERTQTPYITPDFILSQITSAQTMRPLNTIPILGPIPESDHRLGGSFLFFRKNPNVAQIDPLQPDPVRELSPVTVEPPVVELTAITPEVRALPGEYGYFIGSWVATVEHNNSFDTYEIYFSESGQCRVIITNDTARQETTTGNWSWDNSFFRLNAVFRNPPIAYQQNIQWTSPVRFSGNNSFNIMGRAATNGPPVQFTFYRNN